MRRRDPLGPDDTAILFTYHDGAVSWDRNTVCHRREIRAIRVTVPRMLHIDHHGFLIGIFRRDHFQSRGDLSITQLLYV